MKLLIKFPTRNRKEKFFETFKKYQNNLKDPNTKFLVSIDIDDESMNNSDVIQELENYQNTKVIIGVSDSKVHAVNRDIDVSDDWDIILLASDDMIPQIVGFDTIIINLMKQKYPDTDGILFFNDGFQKDKLNTLCILGKKYYNRFGYIYYPEYKSTWCDNEFMFVGKILNKQTYYPTVIIKHEHPDWGYGSNDEIHFKNLKNLNYDRDLFYYRQKNNFFL